MGYSDDNAAGAPGTTSSSTGSTTHRQSPGSSAAQGAAHRGDSGPDAVRHATADIARDLRAAGAEQGKAALERVRHGADEALAEVGDKAASRVDSLASTARDLGRSLKDSDQPTLGRFAEEAASSIGAVSERLRNGNVEQLMSEAQRLARANPGLFVLGSVAIGFGLARFLKASDSGTSRGQTTGDGGYGRPGVDTSERFASGAAATHGGRHAY
ncbi:MAG: hypothetical protein AB7P21_13945 [Lautropia sp.]